LIPFAPGYETGHAIPLTNHYIAETRIIPGPQTPTPAMNDNTGNQEDTRALEAALVCQVRISGN
jgi:hypothetical protein